MTRKATPYARHPLPSPGSPVCVCLSAGQLRGAGGRGAGCAGLSPILSSWGSFEVVLQEKFAGCPAPLERGPGGSMAAWEQRSPRAPGPISPRARSYSTSSLIPPDLAMHDGSLHSPLPPASSMGQKHGHPCH